jgi:hypothetical protein
MPNRIIREGIISSRRMAALSDSAEILYRRLMSVVDDYGRCEADPDLIRARCFPLQLEKWTVQRIASAMAELTVNHGEQPWSTVNCGEPPLISVYSTKNKNYLQINNFGQRIQAKAKFPGPDDHDSTVSHGGSRWLTAQSESESYIQVPLKPAVTQKTERSRTDKSQKPKTLQKTEEVKTEDLFEKEGSGEKENLPGAPASAPAPLFAAADSDSGFASTQTSAGAAQKNSSTPGPLPSAARAAPGRSHGSRFAGFADPQIPLRWARTKFNWDAARAEEVLASFTDYWAARPGKEAQKLDWLATWRNWCRKEDTASFSGKRPVSDDVPWSNFK